MSGLLLLSAVAIVHKPTLSNEKNKGVKVIITNSVDEKLNINMLSNITIGITSLQMLNIFVSEPVVSEGINVNLYGSVASNSLYKFKGNEFKSILHDIEMRKLDNTKNLLLLFYGKLTTYLNLVFIGYGLKRAGVSTPAFFINIPFR